jgi:hypothetical protein
MTDGRWDCTKSGVGAPKKWDGVATLYLAKNRDVAQRCGVMQPDDMFLPWENTRTVFPRGPTVVIRQTLAHSKSHVTQAEQDR